MWGVLFATQTYIIIEETAITQLPITMLTNHYSDCPKIWLPHMNDKNWNIHPGNDI
jgi:hypothetical protein